MLNDLEKDQRDELTPDEQELVRKIVDALNSRLDRISDYIKSISAHIDSISSFVTETGESMIRQSKEGRAHALRVISDLNMNSMSTVREGSDVNLFTHFSSAPKPHPTPRYSAAYSRYMQKGKRRIKPDSIY